MADWFEIALAVFGGSLIPTTITVVSEALKRKRISDRTDKKDEFTRLSFLIDQQEKIFNKSISILTKRTDELAKDHEECLRRNEALVSKLEEIEKKISASEMSTYALVIADCNGKIIEWDATAQSFFHYSRDEAIGKSIMILMPLRTRDKHSLCFRNCVNEDRQPRLECLKIVGRRKDGVEIPLNARLSSWKNNGERNFAAEFFRNLESTEKAAG